MPPLSLFDKTVIALALTNTISLPIAQAETINVDADAGCSLAQAIRSANTDTSVASCVAGDGADIIDIPEQTITLTSADPDGISFGDSGLPLVTSEITIQGNGSTIERVSGDDFRIIALFNEDYSFQTPVSLTLNSLTLTGGRILDNGFGAGGAIFVGDYISSLTLNDTTISGNYSDGDGGAVFASYGTSVDIKTSSVSNNTAAFSGGGIYADQVATLSISDSTIDTNVAELSGGGIWVDYTQNLDIIRSTISNNSASDTVSGYGGGMYAERVIDIEIINSTISNNTALTTGSGISVNASTLAMINSTVSDNIGAESIYSFGNDSFPNSLTLINTVIANSQSSDCSIEDYSVLTTSQNNWFEDASCDGVADGDPGLGALSDNGGLTLTHEPELGSGLIGSAIAISCPSTDQRNELRSGAGDVEPFFITIVAANGNVAVVDLGDSTSQCDIGSVEAPDPTS